MKRTVASLLLVVCLMIVSCAQTARVSRKPIFPCSPRLNNPYGVCSNISNGGEMWEYDRRNEEMALLHEADIGNVRTGGGIGSISPDKNGVFHPEVMDSMTLACLSNGIQIEADLFLDANGKAWNNNYAFYEKYVRYMASRYKGIIPYWETTNEVNLLKDETDLVDKYTDFLSKVYPWFKQSDCNVKVLLSGLGGLDDGFIEELSKKEAYKYFDIMNFHSYKDPESLIKDYEYLADVMSKYGWNKPVWLTECGMHTARASGNKGFYEEIVPFGLKQIGLEKSSINIGVINDPKVGYHSFSESEEETYLQGYKSVRHIDFTNLETISISEIPVIIATNGSIFPGAKIDILVDYVKRGGTIITPYATPFYYDLYQDGSVESVGDKYLHKFHMSQTFPWSIQGKLKGVPEIPTVISRSSGYKGDYQWTFSTSSQGRYADERNLEGEDKLIPFIKAGDDSYMGCVAGLYKLNSNLKGNIIFQTRIFQEANGGEVEQARRLPRIFLISFAHGVDKVFWYNLRSRENDLSYSEDNFGLLHKDLTPKPAFEAYRFLIKMCPDKSTRPTLNVDNGIYISSWTRPDRKKVLALWSINERAVNLDYNGHAQFYNHLGDTINKPIKLNQGVIYVVGAKNVTLETCDSEN